MSGRTNNEGVMTPAPEISDNESLLLEIPEIKIRNFDFIIFLTNRRLILSAEGSEAGTPADIPLPVIRSMLPDISSNKEPTLFLSIKAPDGSDKRVLLTFSQNSRGDRTKERDRLQNEIEHCRQQLQKGSLKADGARSSKSFSGESPGQECHPPPPPQRDFNIFGGMSCSPWTSVPGTGFNRSNNPYGSPVTEEPAYPLNSMQVNSSYTESGSLSGYERSRNNSMNFRGCPSYASEPGKKRTKSSRASRPPKTKKAKRKDHQSKRRNSGDLDFFGSNYVDTDSIFSTILGFIRSPYDAFRSVRGKEPADTIPIVLISLAVFAFGSTLFLGLIASDSSTYPVLSSFKEGGALLFVTIEIIILGIFAIFINGVLLHFGASREGFDRDMGDSIKVAAYSSVPYLIGGLIPLFGIIIAPIWSFILQIIGMEETFLMDLDQAVAAVLIPLAVFAILFIMFVIFGMDNFSVFGEV